MSGTGKDKMFVIKMLPRDRTRPIDGTRMLQQMGQHMWQQHPGSEEVRAQIKTIMQGHNPKQGSQDELDRALDEVDLTLWNASWACDLCWTETEREYILDMERKADKHHGHRD